MRIYDKDCDSVVYTLTCENSYKDLSYHRLRIGRYKIIRYEDINMSVKLLL